MRNIGARLDLSMGPARTTQGSFPGGKQAILSMGPAQTTRAATLRGSFVFDKRRRRRLKRSGAGGIPVRKTVVMIVY